MQTRAKDNLSAPEKTKQRLERAPLRLPLRLLAKETQKMPQVRHPSGVPPVARGIAARHRYVHAGLLPRQQRPSIRRVIVQEICHEITAPRASAKRHIDIQAELPTVEVEVVTPRDSCRQCVLGRSTGAHAGCQEQRITREPMGRPQPCSTGRREFYPASPQAGKSD